jgi:hypothetical protein
MNHQEYAKKHNIEPLSPEMEEYVEWAIGVDRKVQRQKLLQTIEGMKRPMEKSKGVFTPRMDAEDATWNHALDSLKEKITL